MRRVLIAGNWKMNLSLSQARELVTAIGNGLSADASTRCDIAICPPFVYLHPIAEIVRRGSIQLGAQDVYFESKGAFTGEVSAAMLADVGARYIIVGHSERRHTIGHHEDDRMINLKVRATQAAGLTPILCVGETLEERMAEQTLDVLTFQLTAGVLGARVRSSNDLVVAYEPVWAIGTGQNATPEQAQEAHAHLRGVLRGIAAGVADEVRILYGGSVKADNAEATMRQPDVDGGLIGGASLKADSFLGIIRGALAAKG